MASTYTTNLHLEKPDGDDDISVLAINGNSDILDAAIKALREVVASTSAVPTQTTGSKWTGGTMRVRKRSGICEIKFEGVVLSALTSRETLAMIPEGYRPATETYFFSSEGGRSFLITTGGELKANSQPSGTIWATGVYISA